MDDLSNLSKFDSHGRRSAFSPYSQAMEKQHRDRRAQQSVGEKIPPAVIARLTQSIVAAMKLEPGPWLAEFDNAALCAEVKRRIESGSLSKFDAAQQTTL
jgi:hypothetical protein